MSTRWSYKVVELKPKLFAGSVAQRSQLELDKLGAHGWELVSALPTPMGGIWLLLKKA